MNRTTLGLDQLNQLSIGVALRKEDYRLGETHVLLDFAMRLAFYAALTAIFLMVVALIVKLMWNCDVDEASGETIIRATENSRLLSPQKADAGAKYGTNKDDLESGSSSSSEDLYDRKICVICYDDQRNCFFIPCGHCITCHTCAHRIMNEESKSCPICRGIIEKVRKLHVL